ncbi:DUF6503 family protein [Winogradskyella luteola]|uniref:Deoxyribose-phosphate aldolase n=1 Tax=Winogradskyella luteola TaxID=2828330 RepID=A0A9X1FAQ8_9FLAO|nr:DUF6503 family protein [Winogradskyella luteola]MBV7270186.1 deoxyribose-phosphate aldolase [Winogradskyella luteola]
MKYSLIVLMAFIMFSCNNKPKIELLSAEEIISKSIEVSGSEKFENSIVRFDFREMEYIIHRNRGHYHYERRFNDDLTEIHDVLSNDGFERTREGVLKINVADSMKTKYSSSINSVQYFASLPYGLNAKAVKKALLGEEQIKDRTYYKIKVTFKEEGGGEDFEDVFVYWVDKKSFKVDYLAYSYNEDDGKGMRFREAYNERYVNGLRFVDYNNYKTEDTSTKLVDLGKAFENNQLKLLSKIELKNIAVELINYL